MPESDKQADLESLQPLLRQMLLRMKFEYEADSFALLVWDRMHNLLSPVVSRPNSLYGRGVPAPGSAWLALRKCAVILGETCDESIPDDPPCKMLPGSAIGLRICRYRTSSGSPEGKRFVLAVPLCNEISYSRRELLSGDFIGVVEFFRADRPFDDEEAALLLLQGRRLGAVLEHALEV
jgi:hypothetical protein